MEKIIIYLVGHGGSGKTSAATYLQQKYNFTPFAFSASIREYAATNNIPLRKRADYANTHAEMLKKYGWDYVPQAALNSPDMRVCIDDVRSRRYAELIQRAGGVSIAFDCPLELRFAHTLNHPDRAKYPASLRAFMQNEQDDEATGIGAGLEFETDALMKLADHHIDATGSLRNTYDQLDDIVAPLLGK